MHNIKEKDLEEYNRLKCTLSIFSSRLVAYNIMFTKISYILIEYNKQMKNNKKRGMDCYGNFNFERKLTLH